MKAIYPWAEMQVGDVREVTAVRSRKAVYSAGWEYSKKHRNEDGSRPKFDVRTRPTYPDETGNGFVIERTA